MVLYRTNVVNLSHLFFVYFTLTHFPNVFMIILSITIFSYSSLSKKHNINDPNIFSKSPTFLNYTSNKRISMFSDKISKFAIFLNYNINIINLGLDHLNNSFLSVIDSI